jgi:hypothetical protein
LKPLGNRFQSSDYPMRELFSTKAEFFSSTQTVASRRLLNQHRASLAIPYSEKGPALKTHFPVLCAVLENLWGQPTIAGVAQIFAVKGLFVSYLIMRPASGHMETVALVKVASRCFFSDRLGRQRQGDGDCCEQPRSDQGNAAYGFFSWSAKRGVTSLPNDHSQTSSTPAGRERNSEVEVKHAERFNWKVRCWMAHKSINIHNLQVVWAPKSLSNSIEIMACQLDRRYRPLRPTIYCSKGLLVDRRGWKQGLERRVDLSALSKQRRSAFASQGLPRDQEETHRHRSLHGFPGAQVCE